MSAIERRENRQEVAGRGIELVVHVEGIIVLMVNGVEMAITMLTVIMKKTYKSKVSL